MCCHSADLVGFKNQVLQYKCNLRFNYLKSLVNLFPVTGHSLLRICTRFGMWPLRNFRMVTGQFFKRSSFVFKKKSVKYNSWTLSLLQTCCYDTLFRSTILTILTHVACTPERASSMPTACVCHWCGQANRVWQRLELETEAGCCLHCLCGHKLQAKPYHPYLQVWEMTMSYCSMNVLISPLAHSW